MSTETEMLLLARRTRRRHEHVSVPIFVRLFRLLFSLSCCFENSKIFRASVHPIVQRGRQPVHPFIQLSINPSIYPSIHPSIHPFNAFLSRGSYFCSVHKYLPRQLHLALSRGVYSAFVCIISNLLNIFHIINFNYLCSLSLPLSLFYSHFFFRSSHLN